MAHTANPDEVFPNHSDGEPTLRHVPLIHELDEPREPGLLPADIPTIRSKVREGSVRVQATRFLNVFVAVIGIVLTAPLMLLIGFAVAVTSNGPSLCRQERVRHDRRRTRGPTAGGGRRSLNEGGQVFTMYKFRSMYAHRRSPMSPQVWARPNDPRITSVGSIVRKHRLDELPRTLQRTSW